MPKQALWCALQKYGVPECIVDLVHSFHDGMVATVVVSGEEEPPFEVRNGLRQGCTIATSLYIEQVGYIVIMQLELRCFTRWVGNLLESIQGCLSYLNVCWLMMQP